MPDRDTSAAHEGRPLRLMFYDRTCRGRTMLPGLSHAWASGGALYRALGRIDAWHGVSSWDEAFAWLGTYGEGRPIAEIQYWGHGKWGAPKIAGHGVDAGALGRSGALKDGFVRIAKRMLPGREGLFWLRTCEAFGGQPGHELARVMADTLGCRVAGHTFIIGHWQSGLHTLMPGSAPTWADDEAILEGTPKDPRRAAWSRRTAPNTITFLHGTIPAGY